LSNLVKLIVRSFYQKITMILTKIKNLYKMAS
jgi:hypothetical protein